MAVNIRDLTGMIQSLTQNRLRDCTNDQLALLFNELRWATVRVIAEQARRGLEAEDAKGA
jgi:hypothetical protein